MEDEQLTASTPCGLDQQFPPHLHFRVTWGSLEVLSTHQRPTKSKFGAGEGFKTLSCDSDNGDIQTGIWELLL